MTLTTEEINNMRRNVVRMTYQRFWKKFDLGKGFVSVDDMDQYYYRKRPIKHLCLKSVSVRDFLIYGVKAFKRKYG